MMAPNLLRVDNEETIIIQAHGYGQTADVNIIVSTFPEKNMIILQTTTKLSQDTNYVAKALIRIPLNKLPPESRGKQYVIVQAAVSGVFDLEKPILLSPNPGNIFIQTDKPIYTPDNRVNYKIFCTDHNMQPISQSVIIQIQNPDGIIINQNTVMPINGVISANYQIPELVIFGTWKIVARFQDKVQAEYTAGFEVREYVLPAFNVELTTEQNYFHYKAEKLTILITANHLFGEPVDGYAVVLFGIYKDSMKAIHGSLQKVQLDDGVGEAVLSKDVLTKEISNTDELIGASIYVNVTVFSSGGDYVQQQKTGIKIESSPYTIEFVRTPSYFKPGIPFKFGVYVTNPDKTPAAQIKVICTTCKDSGGSGSTSPEGLAFLNINPDISDSQLAIGVSTDDKNLDKNQQAKAQMSASAYRPLSFLKNFLHIDVKTTVITDHVDVTLIIRIDPIMNKDAVKYVTVLVVSKGKILQTIIQKKSPGTEIIALRIDVTRNMLPSFRLVGYYYLQIEGNVFDIVSDSVWVHMKRTCIGTLNVKSKTDQIKTYSPQEIGQFILSGDNESQVELGIIDKAVFVLNNKNKLTQNKIWDTVEQSDIACTAGSGANFLGVFHDAGLDFTASNRAETPSRKDIPCDPEKPVRRKRAIEMLEAKQKKVNGSPDHLKSCCAAGWQKSPMGLSCIKRKEHVNMEKECVDLFFECCELAEELRRKYEEDPELGKSDEEECIECVSDNVKVRTNFKESWHWQRINLSESSSKDGIAEKLLQLIFPDSITTWVLQAISIHKDKGVCVADPFEMVVFQSFFVDLRLPYSVVKNEQVQIRAVIYNYSDKDIQVVITFPFKENVCSLANKHKSYQQTVSVPKKKSRVVKYVIIPLKEGNVEIEVRADVKGEFVSDRVKKNLNVMPEGKIKRIKTFSHLLNPGGRSLVIPITAPALERMVPGSTAENFISIQGDLLGETLLGTLDDTYLGRLIYVPWGCPEQNMVHITPNVIVTRYLDSTMKWEVIGAEKRKRAIENIKTGYSTQLSHRLADHSFTGTTWLTAYVVKIFALASSLIHIDQTMLCNSASWLITRQQNSGWFEERGTVYARSIQGGFVGAENDASLTAFVVIALHEVDKKCSIPAITNALRRAEKYLENQLPILKQTYSVVISSYALSLVGNLKGSDIIDRFVSKDGSYWPVDNDYTSMFTVEATGYALLQKLKLKKYEQARQIAEWLVGRRQFGGGYSSTQATVVAMEALAQFEMNTPKDDTINLDIQISVEGRASPVPYTITKDDAYVQRTSKARADKNLKVVANGTGIATITVMTSYYTLLTNKEKCKGYEISTELQPDETGKDAFKMIIKTRYTGTMPATMSLIEVTMLTGFYPNKDDLKQLTDSTENYIWKFEANLAINSGSVVIYLHEVSNKEETVIGFRVHKEFDVGMLQPADVTIYEYYDQDKKCSTFYNLPDESDQLMKLCKGSLCKCAVEKCCTQEKISSTITLDYLYNKACKQEGIYDVFKVILKQTDRQASFDSHTLEVLQFFKKEDENDHGIEKHFISHTACRESLKLEVNKKYLIMSYSSDLWPLSTETVYAFSSKTFVMTWPEENEGQDKVVEALTGFSKRMENGCDT